MHAECGFILIIYFESPVLLVTVESLNYSLSPWCVQPFSDTNDRVIRYGWR